MKKPAKYTTEQKFTPPQKKINKKYKLVPLNHTNNISSYLESASTVDDLTDYMVEFMVRQERRARTRQQSYEAAI